MADDIPEEVVEILEGITARLKRQGSEIIALRLVCASLMADIAIRDSDPRASIAGTSAALMGVVDQLGRANGAVRREDVSATVEAICAMAEKVVAANTNPAGDPAQHDPDAE